MEENAKSSHSLQIVATPLFLCDYICIFYSEMAILIDGSLALTKYLARAIVNYNELVQG